jgi:membrane fusion protein (multidrug efflux system)
MKCDKSKCLLTFIKGIEVFGSMSKTETESTANEAEEKKEPEEQETAGPEPAEETEVTKSKKRRNIAIGAGIVVVIAIVGLIYWLYARQFESTDDAFIEGDIIQVSPKVSAYVSKIYVKSNQMVHKGDPLVDLDPTDLQIKLEQAKAALQNAKSQRGLAKANVELTSKTTGAAQSQAKSNVQTTQSNVEQARIAAEAKRSQIGQAQTAVKTARANLAQTRTQVPQAQSNVNLAQVEYNRRLALFNKGDISQQSLDQALNALQTTRAQLDAAEKQVAAAESRVDEALAGVTTASNNFRQSLAEVDLNRSQVNESTGRLQDAQAAPERIGVTEAQVGAADAGIVAAEAAVHQAETELSYAKILAPSDGYITRKTIEEGQLVQVGTPLMAISQADDLWVIANFKETQLETMQPGQKVDIKIDAYPGQSFEGQVQSFQAGTGSRFSVLPPENATGNYVKVVQRIPVKIVFDKKPDDKIILAPGMSVEPRVKVR